MAGTGRRQILIAASGAFVLAPVAAWLAGRPGRADGMTHDAFPVERPDRDWRRRLTPDQYYVLRERGTERAFTSPLDGEKRRGRFLCAACGHPLFASVQKFDSGTGWPSFSEPLAGAVGTSVDRGWLSVRTEVHCANCGGHLGHVFPDGPAPTGLRYCMNGVALSFEAHA